MNGNTGIASAFVVALALAGCATSQGPTAAKPKVAASDPTCLQETGSLLPRRGSECSGIGRSYSNSDIQGTGKTSAAAALPLLDPSITR